MISPAQTAVAAKDAAKSEPKQPAVPKETIKQAIADGKAGIKNGKTKVEAAVAIWAKLKDADREAVVWAFIEGAGLTEKGTLTCWNNCWRKVKTSTK
jgi:hypothetical protein